MRVFYRIKNIKDLTMPLNPNISNALDGALQLGLECIPYHNVKEIYDDYQKGDIVLDGILQVTYCFNKFGIQPQEFNYPEVLKEYLGRKIWKDTMDSISSDETKWSAGNFVKPVKEKVFTGKIISSIKDMQGCGSCYENFEVYVSEPLNILYECRGFVYYDKLIDLRPYHGDYKEMRHMDTELIECAMKDWLNWPERPMACSLDWGVVKRPHKFVRYKYNENREPVKIGEFYEDAYDTLFIEGNLPYALGCYGLNPIDHIKMISAYTSQISNTKDELKF